MRIPVQCRAQKEHPPAAVTPERLQGSIVDNTHRNAQRPRKLKPIHPLPKCLGSFAIRPLRTGVGKPMAARSNLHPRAVSLSFAISCWGLSRGPEGNSRSSRDDLSSFTYVPPTSTTKTFLFMSDGPDAFGGTSGRVAPFAQNAGRCPVVLVLPQCWLASILLFQGRQIGRASAAQISNRVAGSSQFAVPSGCH
jgi:hypothetical protein